MGKFFNFRDIVICISGIFFRWGAWNKKFVEFFSIGGQIGNRRLGYLSCQNIRNHTKHDKNFFNIHLHVFNSQSIVLSLIRLFLCFYIPNVYTMFLSSILFIFFFFKLRILRIEETTKAADTNVKMFSFQNQYTMQIRKSTVQLFASIKYLIALIIS